MQFTLDVEDWHHALQPQHCWEAYEDRLLQNMNYLLGLLETYHIHATCYILGSIAALYPDLIKRLVSGGHQLGSHGYWHNHHELEGDADDRATRRLLTKLTNQCITAYRSPFWDSTPRPGYAGGVFFRLLPYPLLKAELYRTQTLYLHPHDVDPNHPRYPFVPKRRYVGLHSAQEKLERLLQEVRFDEPI